ncbi:unnamed protein product [Heterobilharzia americana]|nr:unnamed protein product [Heterobilharzia americana]
MEVKQLDPIKQQRITSISINSNTKIISLLLLLLLFLWVPSETEGFSSTPPLHSLLCSLLNLAPRLPTSSHFFLTPSPTYYSRTPNSFFPIWIPLECLVCHVMSPNGLLSVCLIQSISTFFYCIFVG